MTSFPFLPRWALTHFVALWFFLVLASCHNDVGIVRNGNFEDLVGYYPAGVVLKSGENQKAVVKQWTVQEGAIEIISSKLWRCSTANSLYALHLNTPSGPGTVQTRIQSTLIPGGTYLLAFDVASPSVDPAVKRLEVSLSSCGGSSDEIRKSFFFNFLEGSGLSRQLTWTPVKSLFAFKGTGRCAVLSFRSLTPGSSGIILDNVMLSPTSCAASDCEQVDMFLDRDISHWSGTTSKSTLGRLKEKFMISAETWFRQRFLRPVEK